MVSADLCDPVLDMPTGEVYKGVRKSYFVLGFEWRESKLNSGSIILPVFLAPFEHLG